MLKHHGILQPYAHLDGITSQSRLQREFDLIAALGPKLIYQEMVTGMKPVDWVNYLTLAHESGFKVIVAPARFSKHPDISEYERHLNAIVNHPALYCFMFLHEPYEVFTTEEIRTRHKDLKRLWHTIRFGILWSGNLTKDWGPDKQFEPGLCRVHMINMKPWQANNRRAFEQGLYRYYASENKIINIDYDDAEIIASAQVAIPDKDGGKREFTIPDGDLINDFFYKWMMIQIKASAFIWSYWDSPKPDAITLASPKMFEQREAINHINKLYF